MGLYNFPKEESLRVVEESKRSCKALVALNAIFIALILVKNDQGTFEDYITISLCNCVYKIITKIIANRLKITSSLKL